LSDEDGIVPRDFLRQARFSPERADKLFPNARRFLWNGLFLSHSGLDYHQILDDLGVDTVAGKNRGNHNVLRCRRQCNTHTT
jgi:hypothetical protein